MSRLISPEQINEIIDRCDITELISSYIPLKKAGRNFKAPCPFHNEKTPSFLVSPDKQIFHCFGCGEGGNALGFLMKYERLDFKEAIAMLAERAGVALHFTENADEKEKSATAELYRITEIACSFYQEWLSKNIDQELKNYLNSRGLAPAIMKQLRIGLAPQQWDKLLTMLRSKNINIKLIERAGLVIARESGGYYDRFRNRLIIPIHDVRNRVIAFGARCLDDSTPKYINSPETPIYIKGRNLFGLHLAKDAIREKDIAVIVEGYFDVITPMHHGLTNIVAASGTALTIDQIRLLKRYSKNVVVIFDADKAGELATLRSLELFLEEEMNIRVVALTKGFDPDLFVRKFGIEKFQFAIANAHTIFDYKFMVLSRMHDKNTIEGKTKIALEMLAMIKKIKSEVMRSEYIKRLAEKINVRENVLIKELNNLRDAFSVNEAFVKKTTLVRKNTFPMAERMLLRLILDNIETLDAINETLLPSDFQDKRLESIIALFLEYYKKQPHLKPYQILNYLEDEDVKRIICELTSDETLVYKEEQRQTILTDCIHRIKSNCINIRCHNVLTQLKEAQTSGDRINLSRLQEEFNALIQLKRKGCLNEKIGT